MVKIIFFGKVGCKNNTKQKKIEAYCGDEVEALCFDANYVGRNFERMP